MYAGAVPGDSTPIAEGLHLPVGAGAAGHAIGWPQRKSPTIRLSNMDESSSRASRSPSIPSCCCSCCCMASAAAAGPTGCASLAEPSVHSMPPLRWLTTHPPGTPALGAGAGLLASLAEATEGLAAAGPEAVPLWVEHCSCIAAVCSDTKLQAPPKQEAAAMLLAAEGSANCSCCAGCCTCLLASCCRWSL